MQINQHLPNIDWRRKCVARWHDDKVTSVTTTPDITIMHYIALQRCNDKRWQVINVIKRAGEKMTVILTYLLQRWQSVSSQRQVSWRQKCAAWCELARIRRAPRQPASQRLCQLQALRKTMHHIKTTRCISCHAVSRTSDSIRGPPQQQPPQRHTLPPTAAAATRIIKLIDWWRHDSYWPTSWLSAPQKDGGVLQSCFD